MTRRVPRRVRAWHDSPWQILLRALGLAAGTALVALIVALLVVPRLLGGTALTVLTGSMEPVLSPGDVVAVRGVEPDEVCREVGVGEIVIFLPAPDDPTLITHRVVGVSIGSFDDGSRCRLLTQGDANSAADAPISPAQVRGVFLYAVPAVGWVKEWVQQNVAVSLGIALVLTVVWWLWPGRRSARTVVALAEGAGEPRESSSSADEGDLRRRELDLRERELDLREQELRWMMAPAASPVDVVGSIVGERLGAPTGGEQ